MGICVSKTPVFTGYDASIPIPAKYQVQLDQEALCYLSTHQTWVRCIIYELDELKDTGKIVCELEDDDHELIRLPSAHVYYDPDIKGGKPPWLSAYGSSRMGQELILMVCPELGMCRVIRGEEEEEG